VGQVIMSEDQGSIMMLIDDCIALWSRMLLNTADTNSKVLNNVISLQKNCIRWVQDLRFSFRRLRREGYQKQGDKSDQISEWYKVALLIPQSMELLHTDLVDMLSLYGLIFIFSPPGSWVTHQARSARHLPQGHLSLLHLRTYHLMNLGDCSGVPQCRCPGKVQTPKMKLSI
jgi:hypothetical protein